MRAMDKFRPGPGWKKLSPIVWEHESGARIHRGGMVRTAAGHHLTLRNIKEGAPGRLLVKINGGNIRRGLMAWAVSIHATNKG